MAAWLITRAWDRDGVEVKGVRRRDPEDRLDVEKIVLDLVQLSG